MALKNNLMFCNNLFQNLTRLLLIYYFHFLKIIKDAVNKSCMNRIILQSLFIITIYKLHNI